MALRKPALLRSPLRRADYLTAILFLAPSLIVFGVFVYYALGFNLYLSFTSWNFLSSTKTFIGLENYQRMIADPRFWKVIVNTFYFSIATVAFSLLFGLVLALILNQKMSGRGLLRVIFFSPYITTTSALALLWIWIFDPNYGLMNYALQLVGIGGPRWLTSTTWAMPALIIMTVWKTSGYAMVIFLAGLTNIPHELREAAQIDGAGPWATLWKITLPLLSPTTFFILFTLLISAFQTFDQVAVMTAGGPINATNVLNYYIYEQAFINYKAGYAASLAVVFFLILLGLTILQLRASRRWVYQP
ncbi:MAG: sugar ABC transporter permease [Chloroflexi bacterium]|nr:sugar ABC transporter permease [Chloroflexota bacterium]